MQVRLSKLKRIVYRGAVLIGTGITLNSAIAASFPVPSSTGPGGSYSFPAGFKAFDPSHIVSNITVDAQAPKIAEWTRANAPGDTMAITGNDLSLHSGDSEGRDSHYMFYGEGVAPAEGAIQRLDGPQVAVTLPSFLPNDAFYLLWARNDNGYGKPVSINRAEAWWIGSDRLAKGEPFSVYGRNLTVGNGKSYVYIEELNQWLTSVSQNPYKADFVLPSNIANGSYTIWAHNGHGREYGWSLAKPLTVVSTVVWSGGTYNVKNYGAKGDGSTDDYTAIANAINAAASDSWSTVYFPAGNYRVAGRLPLKYKSKIRFMGDGMDQTRIEPHANHASSSYNSFLIYNSSNDSKFQDLTFAANQYGGNKLFYARSNYRIDFERVRFSQVDSPSLSHSLEVVDLHKGDHFSFKDCKFILTGRLFYGGARQVKVENCDFYGINDNNTIMSCWGGEEISVVNCSGQSYDDSDPLNRFGWAKGRFFHSLGTWGSTHKIYFGDNRTKDMTPRDASGVDQNSGEGFMCEGENVKWRAYATAATANSVTLPGLSGNVGNAITIIAGKGFGQSREVAASESGVLTTDEPWTVIPDTSSLVVVGDYTRRITVYNNYFDGTPRAVNNDSHIAATGIEPYGGAIDWIVVKNTLHELRQGIDQFARYKDNVGNSDQYIGCPHYFNTYEDNLIDGCRYGMKIYVDKMVRSTAGAISDVSYVGMVYRNNIITNTLLKAVRMETKLPEGKIDLTVYDNNSFHTLGDCIEDDTGQKNHVWIGNTFSGNGTGIGIDIAEGHIPALRDNEWNRFSSVYSGTKPGSVLELPKRVVTLSPGQTTADVDVFNGGTAPLNWTASSDADWVTISQSDTVVQDEADAGLFSVEIDPQAIPAGETEAVVNVSGGGEMKQMTIEYSTSATPPPPDGPPPPVLSSIEISGPVFVDQETSAQYYCTGTYSDGSTEAVSAVWSVASGNASIASDGLLTAGDVAADEPVTISAQVDGKTDSFALTVSYVAPVLDRIEISGPASLDEGTSVQYTCVGYYSDGSSASVSPVWSENSGAAGIDSVTGVLTGKNVTKDTLVRVSASFGGKTDTYDIRVLYVPPALTGITIVGSLSVDEGSSEQYSCVGSYSDGTTGVVSPAWSENSSFASISSAGLFTAGNVDADQSAVISASLGGYTASQAVTINYIAPTITSIEVSGSSTVVEQSSEQYSCEAVYSDGSRQAVTPSWTASGSASISSSGLLTTHDVDSDSSATVSASYNGKSDSLSVVVKSIAPTVTGLSVSGPLYVDEGATASYTCTASYSDGTSGSVTPVWSLVSPYATMNASGVLMAGGVAADQTVVLTAGYESLTANYTVEIRYVAPPVTLTGISISAPALLNENSEVQLSCTALYSDGSSSAIDAVWSVNGPATLGANGLLKALNVEQDSVLTVTASASGVEASATISLQAVGSQVIYPLSGFDGKTVKARLWDDAAQEWHELGEMDSPEELVIENVTTDQWYWISIEEFDVDLNDWNQALGSWLSM